MTSETRRGAGALLDRRVTEALNHPVRVRWLVEANKAPISPVQFQRLHGASLKADLSKVSYHARILLDLGFLEVIDTRPRRGSTEHIYAPRRAAIFEEDCWAALPPVIRDGFNAAIYTTLCEQIAQAIEAGTMELRPERHFTWTQVELDEVGWHSMLARLLNVFEAIEEEREAARERIAGGAEPIPMTVALAGFESPPPVR